jgi:16S rRNA processing protein RimM
MTCDLPSDFLIIGKITAPHGIKGELKVLSYSDFPMRFTQRGMRYLLPKEGALPQQVELVSGYAMHSHLFVVQLAGVSDRNQAEKLRNYLLGVAKNDLPPLGEDEYHVSDLIGCAVIYQPQQTQIGIVSAVLSTGNDLLEITSLDGQLTALVPFVKPITPVVDIPQKRIEIVPPAGLVDHLLARL